MGQLKLKRTNFKIGTNYKIDTKKYILWNEKNFYGHSFEYNFYSLPFYAVSHITKIEKIHFKKGFIKLPVFEIPHF